MILLVRHGETDDNREPERVQGHRDAALNDVGRAQALTIAQRVASDGPIAALYSSHLLRARETAEIIGAELGLEPAVDARFAESDRGEWEGRTWAQIARDDPEGFAAWRAAGDGFRFPNGESLREHMQRVVAALDELSRAGAPALVACHGGTIRVALCHAHGRGLDAFHEWDVPNGALVRL